jgi:hypothetical protein
MAYSVKKIQELPKMDGKIAIFDPLKSMNLEPTFMILWDSGGLSKTGFEWENFRDFDPLKMAYSVKKSQDSLISYSKMWGFSGFFEKSCQNLFS